MSEQLTAAQIAVLSQTLSITVGAPKNLSGSGAYSAPDWAGLRWNKNIVIMPVPTYNFLDMSKNGGALYFGSMYQLHTENNPQLQHQATNWQFVESLNIIVFHIIPDEREEFTPQLLLHEDVSSSNSYDEGLALFGGNFVQKVQSVGSSLEDLKVKCHLGSKAIPRPCLFLFNETGELLGVNAHVDQEKTDQLFTPASTIKLGLRMYGERPALAKLDNTGRNITNIAEAMAQG